MKPIQPGTTARFRCKSARVLVSSNAALILQYTGATAAKHRNFTINACKTAAYDITANNLTVSGASTATNGALTKIGARTPNRHRPRCSSAALARCSVCAAAGRNRAEVKGKYFVGKNMVWNETKLRDGTLALDGVRALSDGKAVSAWFGKIAPTPTSFLTQ